MCASLSRQGTAVPSPNRDATNICALSTLFPYNPLKRLLTLLSCLLRPPSSSERGLHYHYYHSYYSYDTVFVIRECFARASTLITHEHYTFLENRKKQGKQKKRSLGAKLLRIYIYIRTRHRRLTHSVQRRASTESSMPQPLFVASYFL